MNRGNPRTLIRAIALLGVVIAAGIPVLAQAGHGSSFGGSGGGHSGAGHSSGGGGRPMAAPHYAAPRFAGAYPVSRGSYSAPHGYGAPHGNFVAAGARYAAPQYGHRSAGYASGGRGSAGSTGYVAHGYYGRGGFGHRPYWGGGYWRGGYWPHVYYGAGFAWFLPILPLGYATFWWGGIPYYYCNDAYYTWRPDYDGYVVTDPPPVAESASGDDSGDDSQSGGTADVYIYPRNGQSDEQTSNDRFECHKWAVGQTGFDPTRSSQTSGTASEYRRAMIACLGARGYSAK